MGYRVVNNILVNFSGDYITDEHLLIYLNQAQDIIKEEIAAADVFVGSDYVNIDNVYVHPPEVDAS